MHSPERTDKKEKLLEKGPSVVSPHLTTWMYNLSDIIPRSI